MSVLSLYLRRTLAMNMSVLLKQIWTGICLFLTNFLRNPTAVVTICTALPGLLRNVPRLPPVVPGEAGFEFDSVAQQNTLFRVVGGSGGIGKSVSSIASQDAAPSLLRWFCASMYRSGSLMGEMGEMLIASAALPGVRMYLLRTLYVLPKSQSVFQFSEMRTDMSIGKRGGGMEISLATTVKRWWSPQTERCSQFCAVPRKHELPSLSLYGTHAQVNMVLGW